MKTLAQQAFIARQKRRRRMVTICRILLLFWEIFRISLTTLFSVLRPHRTLGNGSILHTGVTIMGQHELLPCRHRPSWAPFTGPGQRLNGAKKSALLRILIVWLGNNIKTIIVAAVSVAVFRAIMTLHNGFSHTDRIRSKLIYSLGGKRKDVLTKVLLPGSIPLIISNMKVNVGLCLVGVIIGEFLAANKGLGYLIIYGSQVFKNGYGGLCRL